MLWGPRGCKCHGKNEENEEVCEKCFFPGSAGGKNQREKTKEILGVSIVSMKNLSKNQQKKQKRNQQKDTLRSQKMKKIHL